MIAAKPESSKPTSVAEEVAAKMSIVGGVMKAKSGRAKRPRPPGSWTKS